MTLPAPENAWWFSSTTYAWLTDISGEAALRGYQIPVSIGMDDVLDDLDFSWTGYVEAGYGRWSLGLDTIYAKISDSRTFAAGPVSGNAALELEQTFLTTRLQYRAVAHDAVMLDVFTGFRWSSYDTGLQVDTGRAHIRRSADEDWFDVILGARAVVRFADHWFLQGTGDIGGFGAESELTWQAAAAIGYQFTPRTSVFAGYRAMGVDYEKGSFRMDTVSHGPVAGLSISF